MKQKIDYANIAMPGACAPDGMPPVLPDGMGKNAADDATVDNADVDRVDDNGDDGDHVADSNTNEYLDGVYGNDS